jgi:hypothetical protein
VAERAEISSELVRGQEHHAARLVDAPRPVDFSAASSMANSIWVDGTLSNIGQRIFTLWAEMI